jgi:hypothetical protein
LPFSGYVSFPLKLAGMTHHPLGLFDIGSGGSNGHDFGSSRPPRDLRKQEYSGNQDGLAGELRDQRTPERTQTRVSRHQRA